MYSVFFFHGIPYRIGIFQHQFTFVILICIYVAQPEVHLSGNVFSEGKNEVPVVGFSVMLLILSVTYMCTAGILLKWG